MKSVLFVIGLLSLATYLLIQPQQLSSYQKWKLQYAISFSPSEDYFRSSVFYNNLNKIREHNSKKGTTFKLGLNQFAATTEQEFVNIYLGEIGPAQNTRLTQDFDYTVDIDWTQKGVVTAVKNQGQCGSCWSFATTGILEALNFQQNGVLKSFSQQQLVDCSTENSACNGGLAARALAYVKTNGITLQDKYEYKALQGTCQPFNSQFKNTGVVNVTGCDGLYNALQGRPVGVSVDATKWSLYSSGILTDCQTSLNHAVLLVGATNDYWRIKNSWGPKWGEAGYIRLGRGNTCGLCTRPVYAI